MSKGKSVYVCSLFLEVKLDKGIIQELLVSQDFFPGTKNMFQERASEILEKKNFQKFLLSIDFEFYLL
jgi:hypothetical protein